VLLAMTAAVLFEAWLIKIGRLQKWPRRYYAATDASLYVQRGWLGLVPFAGTTLCMALTIVLGPLGGVWGISVSSRCSPR
jgi:hypothetical protein